MLMKGFLTSRPKYSLKGYLEPATTHTLDGPTKCQNRSETDKLLGTPPMKMELRIPYRDSNSTWHRRHWLMETAVCSHPLPPLHCCGVLMLSCGDGFTQGS
ncbi:hypothetical protein NPIL_55971 [Nephila pilipes]|uniref:Uncharacterized protein n=1 Tax=Nephila pilipes TaxID=299642 RepID=A0A8X6NWX4_NEPPI|nr:hypothetical protein NPIL_55971 [Nephila pilipes]